jgi:6-phosphogluconolactonase
MRARVLPDRDALADAAVREFVDAAREAITVRGQFLVALAGGRTPVVAYTRLAAEPWRESVDWSRVHFFWGDERAVPPDDPESNFGVARRALLRPIGIAEDRVHRMRGEDADLERAARDYERELRRFAGEPPVLDLVLLGMGADGHVASLFPGSAAAAEQDRQVVTAVAPTTERRRLTLTFPVLLASRRIVVQVAGRDKAQVVRDVMGGGSRGMLPAERLHDAGHRVIWLMDAPAGSELEPDAGAAAAQPE